MFDALSDKLSKAMKHLRGQAKLSESNIEEALREVRMALLEADVHVQVARTFLARVKEKAREFVPPGRASKAVGAIKRAVQTGSEMAFQEALALERELQQQLFESEDAREGLAAHLEKRKPAFKGR